MAKKMVRLPELAEMYDTPIITLRNWCLQGKFRGAVKRGRSWLVPLDAAEDFFSPR